MITTRPAPRRTSHLSLALVALMCALLTTAAGTAGARDAANPTWSNIAHPNGPDARFEHSMVYAPEFKTAIIFGGLTTHGIDSDVWLVRPFDESPSWFRPPASGTAPAPRQGASVVWDSGRHRLIVFGGYGARGVEAWPRDGYNDVWALEFDAEGLPTRWVLLASGEAPSHVYGARAPLERWGAAAIYDSKRERLIIQSGLNRLSNSTDQNIDLARCNPIACPDTPPEVDRVLDPWGLTDMWSFDLAGSGGWTLLNPNTPGQSYVNAIYDREYDRMITVQPFGLRIRMSEEPPPPRPADIRSVDLATNQWTDWPDPEQLAAPGILLASGYSESSRTLYTIGWDWSPHPTIRAFVHALHLDQPGSAGTYWERLPGSATRDDWKGEGSPVDDPISWGAMPSGTLATDGQGEERLLGFGGIWEQNHGNNGPVDLASYDLGSKTWSRLSGRPLLPRTRHALVLDERRGHAYLLGGLVYGVTSAAARPEGLWRLDLSRNRWEVVHPSGEGPPESTITNLSAVGVYDPEGDRILQYPSTNPPEKGGLTECGGAVYSLELQTLTWSRLETAGQTPTVCSPLPVYDSKRHRVLLLNGFTPPNVRNRSVYALDLRGARPAWSRLQTEGTEQGILQEGARAVYDSVADRVLLLTYDAGPSSGSSPTGNTLVESLSFAGSDQGAWSLLVGPSGQPAPLRPGPKPRSFAQVVFDAARNRMLVWGGRIAFSGTTTEPNLYALGLSGTPAWTLVPTAATVPQGRIAASSVFDQSADRLIVFGGGGGTGASRETHALSLSG